MQRLIGLLYNCASLKINAKNPYACVVVNVVNEILILTRNTLDCDQSNYSSRIVFSHIPTEFGQKGISAIRSADPENPLLEPNTEWIGRPLAEIWPFEISPIMGQMGGRSVVGRSSIYTSSYTDLIYSLRATL